MKDWFKKSRLVILFAICLLLSYRIGYVVSSKKVHVKHIEIVKPNPFINSISTVRSIVYIKAYTPTYIKDSTIFKGNVDKALKALKVDGRELTKKLRKDYRKYDLTH